VSQSKTLIVIEGPTASGKTGISIELAKHFNTCILSADSRQFYKEMSIGTAKPSIEEQSDVPHFFIDSHSVTEEVTASNFEEQSLVLLKEKFQTNDFVILVGGSGMFIDALCLGLDDIPSSLELKKQIQKEYDDDGLSPLLEELKIGDIDYYNSVDKNNPMRIQRAIEVIRLTGKTYSEQRVRKPLERPFNIVRFVLNHDRKVLYERINERVDSMMENGLIDEVKSLEQYRKLTSLNTVGYKEIFEFLDGNISEEEAIENLKRNTRRYAKRQLTWFRRHDDAHWIDYTEKEQVCNEIITLL